MAGSAQTIIQTHRPLLAAFKHPHRQPSSIASFACTPKNKATFSSGAVRIHRIALNKNARGSGYHIIRTGNVSVSTGFGSSSDHIQFPDVKHAHGTASNHSVEAVMMNEEIPDGCDQSGFSPGFEDDFSINARAYQVEMYEESLKQNTIVAMPTGSGKTHVAILRMQTALDRMAPDKLIWFLAPTIALCEQQSKVISQQIPSVQVRHISGDDADTWTDVATWTGILKNIAVVVSTHQVLLDAMNHAFIRMDRLSLIVFDEAHNCIGAHPGSLLMDRYREEKHAGISVPSILGLTASPLINSIDKGQLEAFEKSMDSVCKAPYIHRQELLAATKVPQVSCAIVSNPDVRDSMFTKSMRSLEGVVIGMDKFESFKEDPYIIRLRADATERNRELLKVCLEKRKTPSKQQLGALWNKCVEVRRKVGAWAVDFFLSESIRQFQTSIERDNMDFLDMGNQEKRYISNKLEQVMVSSDEPKSLVSTSHMQELVQQLMSAPANTRGIIFVTQVVVVAVLSRILPMVPELSQKFRFGTCVGSNRYMGGKKSELGDFVKSDSIEDLDKFRSGKVNLLIATNVLEEGIDVPACNLVICFDPPPNLKSFIQRRGRARMQDSKLVLFLPSNSERDEIWAAMEGEMQRQVEEENRQRQYAADIESGQCDELPPFRISKTGAKLYMAHAKAHLSHACATMASSQYVDATPYYMVHRTQGAWNQVVQLKATVVLPVSLPSHLRRVDSSQGWSSEKMACQDAAMQAYKLLYENGLVNHNLLPIREEALGDIEKRASIITAMDQWKPWSSVARAWSSTKQVYQRRLSLLDPDGGILLEMDASLPTQFRAPQAIDLYWDMYTTLKLVVGEPNLVAVDYLQTDQSLELLKIPFGHRFNVENRQHVLHCQNLSDPLPPTYSETRQQVKGPDDVGAWSIIRDSYGSPFLFQKWYWSRPPPESSQSFPKGCPEYEDSQPWLGLGKFPKRFDFLKPLPHRMMAPTKKHSKTYQLNACFLDPTKFKHLQLGFLLPSIMHRIGIHLTAEELCNTILKKVGFQDLSLVVTAISSPMALEQSDYQRLEFLGDSVLKFVTTVCVLVNHPHFPEGYLSHKKDAIVTNSRLCRATVGSGLDQFVLTYTFPSQWRPVYCQDVWASDATERSTPKRQLSTKVLADVIESLIGAAFLDGGISRALACIQCLIPDIKWEALESAQVRILKETVERSHTANTLPVQLAHLEELIGYKFQNKSLLSEAMTHASYHIGSGSDACMERLEFLGDAVLDSIIVDEIWAHNTRNGFRDGTGGLSQNAMHLLRIASVNADFLAFLALELAIDVGVEEDVGVGGDDVGVASSHPAGESLTRHLPFWSFLRTSSSPLRKEQREVANRHAKMRDSILLGLEFGNGYYPWAELASLQAPKFLSDMVESVLGAVWVDSGGEFGAKIGAKSVHRDGDTVVNDSFSSEACRDVVERIGILPHLRRLLKGDVELFHPKNRLGFLANDKTVRYECDKLTVPAGPVEEGDDDLGVKRNVVCRVFVDEQLVVEVGGGQSPEEAQVKAADEACKVLMARGVAKNMKRRAEDMI